MLRANQGQATTMREVKAIEIRDEWCKGCYICVEICPRSVLEVDQERWVRGFHPVVAARLAECTGCRLCELLCPDLALSVVEE